MSSMCEKMGQAAVYELLAEECCEFAQAALKMARILRNENPTPVTPEQAMQHLTEEYSDVLICAGDLNLFIDPQLMNRKRARFEERWEFNEKLRRKESKNGKR